jgi:hypothetical protein
LGVEEMGEVEGFIQKQDLEAKKEDWVGQCPLC